MIYTNNNQHKISSQLYFNMLDQENYVNVNTFYSGTINKKVT